MVMAKKVRVKHHFQSPTATTAGSGIKGFNASITMPMSCRLLAMPLPMNADYTVMMFSDFTRKVTMQKPLSRWWLLLYGCQPQCNGKIYGRVGFVVGAWVRLC